MANDTTLNIYGRLLHQWLHAFILTLNNDHPSSYVLPATAYQKQLAQDLKIALKSPESYHGLSILHQLVKSILLAQPVDNGIHSKWGLMVECLLAISALKEDGNFKQPHEVTQMFAQLAYLIRGTILYEAMDNKKNFKENAYESVFEIYWFFLYA